MRRVILSALALLICVSAVADEQSKAALQRVARYVEALDAYDAKFKVEAGDYKMEGSYAVSGDNYYIALDAAEVYSDVVEEAGCHCKKAEHGNVVVKLEHHHSANEAGEIEC